ncbi:unnamed protein product [Paramecium octaurelia]|uniref:Uncharacterized protein n=1 Tax=Paramecium octaurelia TaxID=43137 RepID=A0A8S1WBK6_PAROT|nr:unnamed protein product [Paramecium octaurelia]
MSIKSKIVTQVEDGQAEHLAKLLYPPYQTYFHQAKVAHSKQTLLSSLQQVGMNVQEFQDKPVQQIMQECEQKLKKTYTVKVVGIKDGELAVISKRFALPKKKSMKQISNKEDPIFQLSQQPYQIHSQFPNKQLKAVKKVKDPQDEEFKKRLLNWQAEQFEKMKGKPQAEDTSDEDQNQESQSLPQSSNMKNKKSLPRIKLQKIRRSESPKNENPEKTGDTQEVYAVFHNQNQNQKMSYSRLLNHVNDKQKKNDKTNQSPPLTNQLVVVNINKKPPEPPKLGGIIMELDEEHENYQSDKKQHDEQQQHQTQQSSSLQITQFVLNDTDAMQKRLKKIQEKLHHSEPEGLF